MKTNLALLLMLGTYGFAQAPATFTGTGSMITPRFGHTATLLPNGKVLIAGGNTVCYIGAPIPCLSASSAELYDPVAGTFAPTGNMSSAGRRTGGILLPDGRVFFAFFADPVLSETPASVELYDPATATFNVAGNMATLTSLSSATLLKDGRVLITGYAQTSRNQVHGAELYDAAAGTSTPVANWPAREPFAAIALADGRILFQYYEEDAQVFDPSSGQFSGTAGLCCFDGPPQATVVLNGEVLCTGGNDIGGSESSVELFDPATGTFAPNSRMSTARDGHTSTLLPDSTVLVAAGSPIASVKYHPTATAEIYDPATGTFSATADMRTARSVHTATLLKNGQVLLTGGSAFGSESSISAMSSAELYTPAALIPAPVLFSLSGDGKGQGAIWHAATGEIASPSSPAVAGEALSMYTTSLVDGGVIPPQVAIGGQLAKILFFGNAPGYPGFDQVNFRVPSGIALGPPVPVRLTYLGRPSNEVTISVQ